MKTFELMGEALLARNEGQRQMARAAGQELRQWVARRAAMLQEMQAERRKRHQMSSELSSLTDRELWDLGFSRADIPNIARGKYQR